jgi:hypothetical protein
MYCSLTLKKSGTHGCHCPTRMREKSSFKYPTPNTKAGEVNLPLMRQLDFVHLTPPRLVIAKQQPYFPRRRRFKYIIRRFPKISKSDN